MKIYIKSSTLDNLSHRDVVKLAKTTTHQGLLSYLAEEDDTAVKLAVYNNPACPESLRRKIHENETEEGLSEYFDSQLPLDDMELRKLALESTSPEVLERLSKFKSSDSNWAWDIRQKVAENPNTPPELLTKLSSDREGSVRIAVAKNPNTSPEILNKFSKLRGNSTYDLLRRYSGSNPNTPISTLKRLANDYDSSVRLSVASNPNTPSEVLTKLARESMLQIRDAAMNNSNYNS